MPATAIYASKNDALSLRSFCGWLLFKLAESGRAVFSRLGTARSFFRIQKMSLQIVELVLGGPLDGELWRAETSQVRLLISIGHNYFAEYTRVDANAFAFSGYATELIIEEE